MIKRIGQKTEPCGTLLVKLIKKLWRSIVALLMLWFIMKITSENLKRWAPSLHQCVVIYQIKFYDLMSQKPCTDRRKPQSHGIFLLKNIDLVNKMKYSALCGMVCSKFVMMFY